MPVVVLPGQQNIINNQSFKIKKPCFWSHFSHTTSFFAIFNNNLTFANVSHHLILLFSVFDFAKINVYNSLNYLKNKLHTKYQSVNIIIWRKHRRRAVSNSTAISSALARYRPPSWKSTAGEPSATPRLSSRHWRGIGHHHGDSTAGEPSATPRLHPRHW